VPSGCRGSEAVETEDGRNLDSMAGRDVVDEADAFCSLGRLI